MLKRSAISKLSLVLLLALSLFITLSPTPAASAQNIIEVTTLVDAIDPNDNGCSLREAIYSAWQDDDNDTDCPNGNGADMIIFGVSGTITLQDEIHTGDGELTIQGPIIINGERTSCENGNTADCHHLLHISAGADVKLITN
jgi:CSLREA domain-containing protein